MNTDPESGNVPQDDGFDLLPPSGEFDQKKPQEKPGEPQPSYALPVPPPAGALEDKKSMSWKGFEEEEEEEPPAEFKMNRDSSADDMDMTPMVDVVFLLLIFFMITASFSVIRSVEQPNPETDQPSTTVQELPQDQQDYVECIIDQFNTYRITVRDQEEIEAASNLEMQRVLKQAVDDYQPERLVIVAHEQSSLKKVIAAYSAARIFGINSIEMKTTDKDF